MPKRLALSLEDSAAEALAELSDWTGLGQDALARRLLTAILMVISSALEESGSAEPESRNELPKEESVADLAMRRFGRLPPGFNGRHG